MVFEDSTEVFYFSLLSHDAPPTSMVPGSKPRFGMGIR